MSNIRRPLLEVEEEADGRDGVCGKNAEAGRRVSQTVSTARIFGEHDCILPLSMRKRSTLAHEGS